MESDESLRDELVAEVEAVAPILTEHAPQSEKLGRLDESSVEALRKTLRGGTPSALAAKNATATIPIVFSNVGDPVRYGLVRDETARSA